MSECLQSLREIEVLACVYVFVCLNVCEACECICMHMCVHVNTYICERACVCLHMCVHVCVFMCTHVCACIWAPCARVCMQCVHACVNTCTHVYA